MAFCGLTYRTFFILSLVLTLIFLLGCSKKSSPGKNIADSASGGDSDTSLNSPTDSDSATATESVDTTDKVTMDKQNQTVFSQDQMLAYHVTIAADDLADMEENGNDEAYREASLHVVGEGVDEMFDKVGFRYKGAWSLHHCWDDFGGVRSYNRECARISTKIKFDKYDKDARFLGLKRLNLHAMMGDGSKLRDRLAYSLFNDFGVTTSRTAHAKLYINNVYSGLVIAVEPIDGRFTHFRFPQGGDGNLYKEIWPSKNVDEDWALAQLKTNEKPEDDPNVSDFLAFKDAIAHSTVETFEDEMASQINMEEILRYIAMDRAIRNWDGIMGFYSSETSHNFYWYHDDGPENLFHLIPWDLDNTMQEFDLYMDPQGWCDAEPVPDWNETPLNCDARFTCISEEARMTPPRCDHFIDMLARTQWDAFVRIGNDLLGDVFTVLAMDDKITTWAAQIRAAVDEDPLLNVDEWDADVEQLRDILRDAVYDFRAHMKEGLIEENTISLPDERLLNDPIDIGGLRVNVVNNFEFVGASDDILDDYLYTYGSDGTELTWMWNGDTPIMGDGDLQLNANFVPKSGDWSEYGAFGYPTETEIDLNPYTYMWFSASANTDTRIRIDFQSDNYQEYGDAWPVFSKEFALTGVPAMYRLDIAKLGYPEWAKDAWEAGDGWGDDILDAKVLEHILKKFTGIVVQLFPHSDNSGNMIEQTERITVHIDTIYFE
ncbi:MAG: CotH kinase family protein [Deltaproteobacteria bacterium]|nr:CotH kinase family protein [Deltaproteobacteria bacterium]